MSELEKFKEYVEEQRHLCYGIELGGTPAVVGSIAREYDFLIETIEVYQELNQTTLNENQQIMLDWLKVEHEKRKVLAILVVKELATIISHAQFSDIPVYQSFMMLSRSEQNTVFQMFFQWEEGQEKTND